jgi:hypothetical protein
MKKPVVAICILGLFISGCAQISSTPVAPTMMEQPITSPAELPAQAAQADQALPITTQVDVSAPESTSMSVPTFNKSSDPCNNPYYPVVNGATWLYETVGVITATHTLTAGEAKTFTVTVKSADSTSTMAGACTEEGIVIMDQGMGASFQSDSGSSTLTTQNEAGVSLPNDIQVGDEWSQAMNLTAGEDQSFTAEIITNYKAVGYASVTVPAGTFEALKIEQSGVMKLMGQEITTQGVLWYAQGVGNVRAENGVGSESPYVIQLLDYNIP